jgi:TolC family type I secretion outer membrane protein
MIEALKTTRLGTALVVAALPCFTQVSVGQEAGSPRQLNLMTAVERALDAYPTVGATRAGRDAALGALGEAKAAWFPSLQLAASATRFAEPMIVTPIHGFTPGATPPFDKTLIQGAATMSFTLFDGGARGARISAARQEVGAADASVSASEQELIATVVRTYAQVLTQGETLAAHDQRLAALVTEQSRASQFFRAGRGAEVSVLRADAAVAEAEAVRVSLAAALDVTVRNLARLIGIPPDSVTAEDLSPTSFRDSATPRRAESLDMALESSPEVDRARSRVAAARAGVGVAKGARWPALSLVGRFIDRGSAQGDYTGEWDAGVQLSYPIFTGGATSNRVARSEALLAGRSEELRLAELVAAERVDRAWSALEESRARIASLSTAVAGFREVTRVEQLRLDTGTGTQTDYLKAEADFLSARANLVRARYGLLTARVTLALAAGRLSPAWLAANLEIEP